MPYNVNYTDTTKTPISVQDGIVDDTTSLRFPGKNYTGYSKLLAENFLHLLENFASEIEPETPVDGQLWYDKDASTGLPKLRIYDAANQEWKFAGGVSKEKPQNPLLGDLWVNTDTQQLFLYNGTNWILVGPEFSQSTKSGPKVEVILDTATIPLEHTVINFYIEDNIVAIIATEEFTPRTSISGFTILKPGINLSTKDFVGNGSTNRFWATALAAESLLINSKFISASNFLRKDEPSTTNFGLSVRNNSGITLGSDLTTIISTTANGDTVLYNKNEGSSIVVRTIYNNQNNSALTIFGNKIGINKTAPAVELDIVGGISATGTVSIANSTVSASNTTGALVVTGGVGIGGVLRVGGNAFVDGVLTLNKTSGAGAALLPATTDLFDIGSASKVWRHVYANDITADGTISATTFTGTFSGNVSGTASRLATSTAFKLQGDVTSNTISFNGQQVNSQAYFNCSISPDFISTKTSAVSASSVDELIINKIGTGLQKISKLTFLSNVATVPTGSIFPFAGVTLPSGYLFCDGSEQKISDYPELFNIIGYAYKAIGLLVNGAAYFAVPDLRGRFPLGKDGMQNAGATTYDKDGVTEAFTAGRVTDVTALTVGLGKGNESLTIDLENLPDHKHDLRATTQNGTKGNQFYAIRDTSEAITDADVVQYTGNGPDAAGRGQFLPNSGGIQAAIGTNFSTPIDLMNPYLTINYIIFTGRIA
jgi:microcystin-dependent protein